MVSHPEAPGGEPSGVAQAGTNSVYSFEAQRPIRYRMLRSVRFVQRVPQKDEARAESGVVLITMTIMLTVLLGIAGFSVDIGNWYLNAQRQQRAADAAALSGAVLLPAEPTQAHQKALNTASGNGYAATGMQAYQMGSDPNSMYVSITRTVNNYFVSLFGMKDITITRDAVATYQGTVQAGSPSNVLGNEAPGNKASDKAWEKAATKGKQASYWLTVSAGEGKKILGARWTAGLCMKDGVDVNPDLCGKTGNTEYDGKGQHYYVRVPPGVKNTLAVEIYDGQFTPTNQKCDASFMDAESIDPDRYAKGPNPYCAGDFGESGSLFNTTYELWSPTTSGSKSVLICSRQFDGAKGSIKNLLSKSGDGTYDFKNVFHKWAPLCSVPVATYGPGDYEIKVNTDSDQTGLNMFSLRSAITSGGLVSTSDTSSISLFSDERMEMIVNTSQAKTTFYLARVPSSSRGRTVDIQFFDVGDAKNPLKITILPPEDATKDGAPLDSFDDCERIRPTEDYKIDAPNCQIPNVMASGYNGEPGYNGRIASIHIPIPDGYTCTDADPTKCWIRVLIDYGSAITTQDVTSWKVSMAGKHLRLTQ